MISVRAMAVVAMMVVEGWRRVERKVLAAWESRLPGCQKRENRYRNDSRVAKVQGTF